MPTFSPTIPRGKPPAGPPKNNRDNWGLSQLQPRRRPIADARCVQLNAQREVRNDNFWSWSEAWQNSEYGAELKRSVEEVDSSTIQEFKKWVFAPPTALCAIATQMRTRLEQAPFRHRGQGATILRLVRL